MTDDRKKNPALSSINAPESSPYQDAKDARDAVNQAMHKVDDFATHSTSRVLGPLATKTLALCEEVFRHWFGKEPVKVAEPKDQTDV